MRTSNASCPITCRVTRAGISCTSTLAEASRPLALCTHGRRSWSPASTPSPARPAAWTLRPTAQRSAPAAASIRSARSRGRRSCLRAGIRCAMRSYRSVGSRQRGRRSSPSTIRRHGTAMGADAVREATSYCLCSQHGLRRARWLGQQQPRQRASDATSILRGAGQREQRPRRAVLYRVRANFSRIAAIHEE